MESYGYVETRGLITAIEAADAALKTADVRLTGCYSVGGGIVTVEVTGDVAAVNAAVNAAVESARKLGNYLSSNVIARVDSETKKILINKEKKKEKEHTIENRADEDFQSELLGKEDTINGFQGKKRVEGHSNTESEKIKKLRRQYQDMKVTDLKIEVNNMKLDYTWNQIKGMTKKKLIEILLRNN